MPSAAENHENKSDWQYANIFDKWEQWKLAFKLSSEENVWNS